jgi:hypothetical protein
VLAEIFEREYVVSQRLCTVVLLEKGKNGKIEKWESRKWENKKMKTETEK